MCKYVLNECLIFTYDSHLFKNLCGFFSSASKGYLPNRKKPMGISKKYKPNQHFLPFSFGPHDTRWVSNRYPPSIMGK